MHEPIAPVPRRTRPQETSAVLRSLLESTPGDTLTMGQIVDALGGRGFGILLVLFGMLNSIPAPVPGLSSVLGLPLLFLAWQLVRGRPKPWLPRRLAARPVSRTQLQRMADAARRFRPVERLFKPRLTVLASDTAHRLIGIACLILASFIVLPIPMGNWPPAIGITFFGFALAKRDGFAALIGLAAGVVALALVLAVVLAATHVVGIMVD